MNKLKLILFCILTGLIITAFPGTVLASNQVSFSIGSKQYIADDNHYDMDVASYIKRDRTFLPVSYVAVALGISESDVKWDNQEQSVTLDTPDKEVTLHIGKKEMLVRKKTAVDPDTLSMEVAPEITNGRTMIPLRCIAEVFGVQVNWDSNTKSVLITNSQTEPQPPAPADPVSQQQVAVVTGTGVNIRSGPSKKADILTSVKKGTSVTIQGRWDDWYQINYGSGESGYIASNLVYIQNQSQPSRGGTTGRDAASILKGKKIVIDPGHGGTDPGAIGVTGLQEKDFVLDAAQRLSLLLNKLGANTIITRPQDVLVSLEDRPDLANNLGADVFVSIHANASENPDLNGTTTYYHVNTANSKQSSLDNKSARLANSVHQALLQKLNLTDKGTRVDPGIGYVVLRESKVPAILVEAAFLSNSSDEAQLKRDDFRQKVAEGITSGLVSYFAQ